MKNKLFKVAAVVLCCAVMFVGCGNKKAKSATELVKNVLESKDLKTFYNYAIDGEKNYKNLSSEQKEQANKAFDKIKSTHEQKKDQIEFKEVQDENSDYIRVFVYTKGTSIKSEKEADIFYIKNVNGEYRFDPNINGYSETYLSDYVDQKLIGKKTFRVFAKIDDTYEFETEQLKNDYYVLKITEAYSKVEVDGFVKKDSEEGEKLKALLENGDEKQFTFKMKVPDWLKGGEGKLLIDEIASFNWAY